MSHVKMFLSYRRFFFCPCVFKSKYSGITEIAKSSESAKNETTKQTKIYVNELTVN